MGNAADELRTGFFCAFVDEADAGWDILLAPLARGVVRPRLTFEPAIEPLSCDTDRWRMNGRPTL
jgi:hypothetical protein